MISNLALHSIMIEKKYKDFKGVYCKDQLKDIKFDNGAYIINLQNNVDDKGNLNNGTHWVALYINNDFNCFYFDAFGFAPPLEVVNFNKKKYKVAYSQHQIQYIYDDHCGWYCILFLMYCKMNKNMTVKLYNDFINIFDDNFIKNKNILRDYLKLFKINFLI